jgi:hypothetical protein
MNELGRNQLRKVMFINIVLCYLSLFLKTRNETTRPPPFSRVYAVCFMQLISISYSSFMKFACEKHFH